MTRPWGRGGEARPGCSSLGACIWEWGKQAAARTADKGRTSAALDRVPLSQLQTQAGVQVGSNQGRPVDCLLAWPMSRSYAPSKNC